MVFIKLAEVIDAPTPILPVVVKLWALIPARDDIPETFKDDILAAEVTDKLPPIPTLPVVTKDPPIPKLPEKNPVPVTSRFLVGKVVPIPTLPLSKTVNPWVRFDP